MKSLKKGLLIVLSLLLMVTLLTGCEKYKKEDLLKALDATEDDFSYIKMSETEADVVIIGVYVEDVQSVITRMTLSGMLSSTDGTDRSRTSLENRYAEIQQLARDKSVELQKKMDETYKGVLTVETTICNDKGKVVIRARNGKIVYDYAEGTGTES